MKPQPGNEAAITCWLVWPIAHLKGGIRWVWGINWITTVRARNEVLRETTGPVSFTITSIRSALGLNPDLQKHSFHGLCHGKDCADYITCNLKHNLKFTVLFSWKMRVRKRKPWRHDDSSETSNSIRSNESLTKLGWNAKWNEQRGTDGRR
jgi:hypothetical protein